MKFYKFFINRYFLMKFSIYLKIFKLYIIFIIFFILLINIKKENVIYRSKLCIIIFYVEVV